MVFINKNFGFTLSEVMLTLSLIGVLATLTVSTIGSSIQQRARQAEFLAAYAKIEAALRSVTIDEGKIYNCYLIPTYEQTEKFGLEVDDEAMSASTPAECLALETAFVNAMGVTKKCLNNPKTEKCLPQNYPKFSASHSYFNLTGRAYIFDNSMIMLTSDKDNGMRNFAIDINGRSGPNKWGQDIFPFSVVATETAKFNNKIYVKSIAVLPPDDDIVGDYNEGRRGEYGSGNVKTTTEMLEAAINKK